MFTESYYFPVIYEAGSWQKLALKTQRKAFKSPEFVPSSADETPDSANEGAKMQPKVTSAGRRTQKAQINTENIGEGYTVYDPHQPRQRIGAVTKVNLRQHGEVDVIIQGRLNIGGSKHQTTELKEIAAKAAELEIKFVALTEKMQNCHGELHAMAVRTGQENTLSIYNSITETLAGLRSKQQTLKAKLR
ncbi:hypothetical protein BDN67DRAFT_980516 [Paxillus ammoniavirescens]|nr:hypothetical protein BDN67DRAFT_980516 [Paxillus ammoniavirescens]